MTRYERLIGHINLHPSDWVKSGIGLEVMRAAVSCAPPEVLEGAKRTLRHDELMREILAKHEQDAEWVHGEEGRAMLAEALSLAPPLIKHLINNKLRELGILSVSEFADGDEEPYTLEQIAEAAGVTPEKVKHLVEELSIWSQEAVHPDCLYMNEDSYRDPILGAIVALQAGDTKEAERHLFAVLEDVERVIAGGEI